MSRTRVHCLGPHPLNPDEPHGVLLIELRFEARTTGRVLSRYEEVQPPRDGVKFVGVRCQLCKRITEVEVPS